MLRKPVAGVQIIVFSGIVSAWPGPSILVASTSFGVYVPRRGFTEFFMAFTLPRSAAARLVSFISGALHPSPVAATRSLSPSAVILLSAGCAESSWGAQQLQRASR